MFVKRGTSGGAEAWQVRWKRSSQRQPVAACRWRRAVPASDYLRGVLLGRGNIACNHCSDQQGVWQDVDQNAHGKLRKYVYVAWQYKCLNGIAPILIPNIRYEIIEYQPLLEKFAACCAQLGRRGRNAVGVGQSRDCAAHMRLMSAFCGTKVFRPERVCCRTPAQDGISYPAGT